MRGTIIITGKHVLDINRPSRIHAHTLIRYQYKLLWSHNDINKTCPYCQNNLSMVRREVLFCPFCNMLLLNSILLGFMSVDEYDARLCSHSKKYDNWLYLRSIPWINY